MVTPGPLLLLTPLALKESTAPLRWSISRSEDVSWPVPKVSMAWSIT